MTMHKNERRPSKFQILADVKKIRNSIVALLLRDFGVKPRTRSVEYVENYYHFELEDRIKFEELLDKYEITSVLDSYPEWYIEKLRDEIMSIAFRLVEYVEFSNVYPTTVHECDMRRDYQDKALACLFDLYQWLELAAITLPLDMTKFEPQMDEIEKAIASLKSLRKYDNKVRSKLVAKERKEIVSYLNNLGELSYNMPSGMLDKALDILMSMNYVKRGSEEN